MSSSCLESLEDQFRYPHTEMPHIIWDVPPGLAERTLDTLCIPTGLSREWGLEPVKNALAPELPWDTVLHGLLQRGSFPQAAALQELLQPGSLPQHTVLQELTDFLVSHCVSWQDGFNDSQIPSVEEFTLLILKESSSWHSIFLQKCCILMNKEEFSGVSYSTNMTLCILERGVWPEEILELSTPAQQDAHTEAEDRLQHCQLLCCFLPGGSDKSPIW